MEDLKVVWCSWATNNKVRRELAAPLIIKSVKWCYNTDHATGVKDGYSKRSIIGQGLFQFFKSR